MGLTYHDVRRLLVARSEGARFDTVATLRATQIYLRPREAKRLRHEFAVRGDWPYGAYAEDFLRELGASELVAIDASDYEGADLIADLNEPLGVEERFDAVIDAGTLEHIFNVPCALANIIRATKTGGRIFLAVPANNLCGHGFYQFSPELMFRVFSETHGCRVRDVSSRPVPVSWCGEPARARRLPRRRSRRGGRAGGSDDAVRRELMVNAEKLRHLPEPLAQAPQQRDYTARWESGVRRDAARFARTPPLVRGMSRALKLHRRYSIRNRRFYRRS